MAGKNSRNISPMKILYFGPIAVAGKPGTGGFESANRKNITALRRLGVDVEEHPYPVVNRKLGALGKAIYLKLLFQPLSLLRHRKATDTIIHFTPLYGNLLFPARLLVKTASLLRIPLLLDIRAGSLLKYHQSRSASYRRKLKQLLSGATAITVEGKAYLNGIKDEIGVDADPIYLPNCTYDVPAGFRPREKDGHFNIFYFGRITGAKGIDTILEIRHLLDQQRFRIFLAGPIASDIRREAIDIPGITYLGLLTPAELKEELEKMHIFLFPTRHIGEGQSNSLIEAMAAGLIPVTSDQGFCSDIASECGKVLPVESKAEDYAAAISEIVNDDMDRLGRHAMEFIRGNHNIETVAARLKGVYESILDRHHR